MDGPPPNLDRPDPRRSEPPEGGYKLYRHRNADALRTRDWHGYYWARRTAGEDYEIRSVPASLGEPSTAAGTVPGEPFERLYQEVDRV
jgi:hypothetical protein